MAQVLRPPVQKPANKRGERDNKTTLEAVLGRMYDEPNNKCFASLATSAVHPSHHTTWVWDVIFERRSKTQVKIKKVLDLVDAIWTEEERQDLINHSLDAIQANQFFTKLAKRAKLTAHVIQTPLPDKPTAPKAQTLILGLANKIGRFPLADYIPRWETDKKIKADMLLPKLVTERQKRIANANIVNPCRRGQPQPQQQRQQPRQQAGGSNNNSTNDEGTIIALTPDDLANPNVI